MASTLNPQQLFAPTVLTTSTVPLYTVPPLTVTVTRRLTFCNTTADAATFTVYYPDGAAAGVGNMIINAESLGAGQSISPPELEGLVLEAGDTIEVKASANTKITVFGAGTEIS